MAIRSVRTIEVVLSEDIDASVIQASTNTTSPGQITAVNLTTGANTIAVISGAAAVTIIPPSSNTELITLKGVTGDTGVPLHLTEPTSIGLSTTASTFVLTVGADIDNVRFVWS